MLLTVNCFFLFSEKPNTGCMKEVWINHKQVDFGNAATQQKVTPGCTLLDPADHEEQEDEMDEMIEEPPSPPDPCLHHHCKHDSKCVPNNVGGDYVCKCRAGFRGKFCEQGEEECKYWRLIGLTFFFYLFFTKLC